MVEKNQEKKHINIQIPTDLAKKMKNVYKEQDLIQSHHT